ncbi:MAG: hypothetical protein AABZ60_02445 [Planctomycetota bacterium]|mgnify:CR=1 FL=1
MTYPIFVEGGITRKSQCDSCESSFSYLFRVPNYPPQKFSFATVEEELQWKKEEDLRLQALLKDQHLLVRCPSCRSLYQKAQHSRQKKIKTILHSWNPFRNHEHTISIVPISVKEEEAFQFYFRCVCEILSLMVRNKKESLSHFHQVTQTLFQRPWTHPKQRSAWCEDLFWKIAILDQYTFPTLNPIRIDKLFQAVYLLNSLDNTVYPALPKKIMEFFSIDILRASRLIQQLGEESHRNLFHF